MTREICRIVPREPDASGLVRTQGTKVLLPSGEEIPMVCGIQLHCDVNDVWRATIQLHVKPPESLSVDAELVAVDRTSLSDVARFYRAEPARSRTTGAGGLFRNELADVLEALTELNDADQRGQSGEIITKAVGKLAAAVTVAAKALTPGPRYRPYTGSTTPDSEGGYLVQGSALGEALQGAIDAAGQKS